MSESTSEHIDVISGHLTGDAAFDTAVSRAILQRVGSGELPETLQVGMPHRVVAFGKHDTLAEGFPQAASIAREHGFEPTVRIAGGRAVVFHPATVRFAWTMPASEPASTMHERFERISTAVVNTLSGFGVAAAIGELPGEYCAGRYSVHLVGGGKVMGVGQRLTRSAAQVGGMIVVDDSHAVNAVLEPIYDALDLSMDPGVTGSVHDVAHVDASSIAAALVDQLAEGRTIVPTAPDAETMTLASTLRPAHVVAPLA
jgi:lipoate-protein ligase A